jgi:hypothetical protein
MLCLSTIILVVQPHTEVQLLTWQLTGAHALAAAELNLGMVKATLQDPDLALMRADQHSKMGTKV